jgi:hypothetical protein
LRFDGNRLRRSKVRAQMDAPRFYLLRTKKACKPSMIGLHAFDELFIMIYFNPFLEAIAIRTLRMLPPKSSPISGFASKSLIRISYSLQLNPNSAKNYPV